MNGSLSISALLAAAGLSDVGSLAALFITLAAASVVPLSWLSHGSWLSVLGVCLLAADIGVAIAVGRRLYRFFHARMHVPEWLVGVPLIPVILLVIALINILATLAAAKVIPGALFASR
jgi:hypothetical protein